MKKWEKQLIKGYAVEKREHADTLRPFLNFKDIEWGVKIMAYKIARDHLKEDPIYYDHLEKMEKKYKVKKVV